MNEHAEETRSLDNAGGEAVVYRTPPLFMWGAVATVSVLLLLLLVSWSSRQWSRGGGGGASVNDADAAITKTEAEQALALEQEQRSMAAARRNQVLGLARDAEAMLSALENELSRWDKHIAPLWTKKGCPIAADAVFFEQFASLWTRVPKNRPDVLGLRENVAGLSKLSRGAEESNTAYNPSDQVMEELQRVESKAAAAVRSWRRLRTDIESLLRAATASGKHTVLSIREAIEQKKAKEAAEAAAKAKAERDKEKRAHLERIAEAEAEAERARQAAALARKKREAEEEKRKAEREALLADARRAKSDGRFSAFLANGSIPFGWHGSTQAYEQVVPPGPASLRVLKRLGVFSSIKAFAEARSDTSLGRHNDRPTTPMPSSTAEWTQCRKDWETFKKLAPVFLELGFLRP